MDHEKISDLLDRYFEGRTTLDEERLLKNYFASSDGVDARLVRFAPLFGYFEKEKTLEMPPREAVQLRPAPSSRPRALRWAMAASLALALAGGTWLFRENMAEERRRQAALERLHKDTFDDPEKALAEVKAALALVSRKLDRGEKNAKKGLKEVKRLQIFR